MDMPHVVNPEVSLYHRGRREAFEAAIAIARDNNDEATLSELLAIMFAEFKVSSQTTGK